MYNIHDDNNNCNINLWDEPFERRYEWIRKCYPNTGCQLKFSKCKFCTSDWCYEHGWNNRLEDCAWVWANCEPETTTYWVNLNFDYLVTPRIVTLARDVFFKELRKKAGKVKYVWRLHFEKFIPHFHATISCNETSFRHKIKSAWTQALKSIEHPSPTRSRVYCREAKDWRSTIWYMFQLTDEETGERKVLSKDEVPPVIRKKWWCYWQSN